MKVAVVGGGIAGLRSAQLLEGLGHEVQLFEASGQLGGRLRMANYPGGWAESGGEWLDADHERCFRLMRELGSGPEKSSQWPGLVISQGEFATENQVWPDAEADAEFVHEKASAAISCGIDSLDNSPLGTWLDAQCTSKTGRWWVEAVTRSDEGEDTDRVDLRGWLFGYAQYLNRSPGDMSLYRFSMPTQMVCETLAGHLSTPPRVSTPVSRIGDDGFLEIGGARQQFDRIICAVPPSQHARLGLAEPPCFMARAVKVILRFSVPWWQQKSWSGRMLCDLPCQQTWSGGRAGLHALSCYICGDEAEWLAAKPDAVSTVFRALVEIHPEAAAHFLGGDMFAWIHEPYIEGAFPSIGLGQLTDWLSARRPVGRIHFAGDWATDQIGFIEGALESAERVAREIE